jgi:ankyrin repeat protein
MGLTPMAEKLVSLGADLKARNQLGSTALHYAAMEGHTATCQKLLKLGADLAAVNEAGSTALALAVSFIK